MPEHQERMESTAGEHGTPAPAGEGARADVLVRGMLARGRPEPEAVARVLRAYPHARHEILVLLHQSLGNSFVSAVLAASAAPEAAEGRGGTPLPAAVRAKVEAAFDTDFSAVRVHQDEQAAAAGAVAYAHGDDLHFQPGAYDPSSAAGQELLGHELTHVVQQRNGQVSVQGKDSPLNDDAGLEAEADAMGAMAARGESTGMSAPARPTTVPALQRYKDVRAGGQPWRLSEGHRALMKTSGSPGDRSHDLWADPTLVGQANTQLAAAGSFIRLASGGDSQNVILREGGRNVALEQEVRTRAYERSSGDQLADYYASLNTELERNEPSGVNERAQELSGARAESSPEQLVQDRGEALRQRREEVRTHDQTVTLTRVKPTFDAASAPPNGTYQVLGALQQHHQRLYTQSDCNETARLIMGVNEQARNEQPVVGTGHAPTTIAPRDITFGKEGGGGTIAERGGLTGLADAMAAYSATVGARGLDGPQVVIFQQQYLLVHANPGLAHKALRTIKDTAPAVYADFAQYAQIDTAVAPEVGDALVTYRLEKTGNDPSRSPRLYRALLDVLMTRLGMAENVAVETLEASQITPLTTYYQLSLRVESLVAAVRLLGQTPEHGLAADALSATAENNVLWNKHWGGVVMKDGADFVTLENDASTQNAPTSVQVGQGNVRANSEWGFAMYGTVTPEQTFHDQMMRTQDFGDFASTKRYRRAPPPQQQPVVNNDNAAQVVVLTADEKALLTLAHTGTTDQASLCDELHKNALAINKLVTAVKAKFSVASLADAAAAAHGQNLLV
jgi:hypothetical protein